MLDFEVQSTKCIVSQISVLCCSIELQNASKSEDLLRWAIHWFSSSSGIIISRLIHKFLLHFSSDHVLSHLSDCVVVPLLEVSHLSSGLLSALNSLWSVFQGLGSSSTARVAAISSLGISSKDRRGIWDRINLSHWQTVLINSLNHALFAILINFSFKFNSKIWNSALYSFF